MKHVITAIVENQPGVLARIVGLISGRGYNIETLNVAPLHEPGVSRLTMTVLYEQMRRKKRYGLAAACIGGGQGIAIIVKTGV